MLKMPSFDVNTRPETFLPLTRRIIDDTLSQAMPDAASVHRRREVDECHKCFRACIHVKAGHFIAFNVT